MKKKFKKLSLNVETLRNLNEPDLKNAVGGTIDDTFCTGVCSECTRACSICTIACSGCCM